LEKEEKEEKEKEEKEEKEKEEKEKEEKEKEEGGNKCIIRKKEGKKGKKQNRKCTKAMNIDHQET